MKKISRYFGPPKVGENIIFMIILLTLLHYGLTIWLVVVGIFGAIAPFLFWFFLFIGLAWLVSIFVKLVLFFLSPKEELME